MHMKQDVLKYFDTKKLLFVVSFYVLTQVIVSVFDNIFAYQVPFKFQLAVFYLMLTLLFRFSVVVDYLLASVLIVFSALLLFLDKSALADKFMVFAYMFFVFAFLRSFAKSLLTRYKKDLLTCYFYLRQLDYRLLLKNDTFIKYLMLALFILVVMLKYHNLILDPFRTVFGRFDDNIDLIWGGWVYKNFGAGHTQLYAFPFGRTVGVMATQLIWPFYFYMSALTNEVFSYNFLFFLNIGLSYYFMNKLIHKHTDNSFVSGIVSMLYTFSPYAYYQSSVHIDLAQIWLVPYFYLTLESYDSLPNIKNWLKLLLSILITVLISNYYGFFLGLVIGGFYLFKFLLPNRAATLKRSAGVLLTLLVAFTLVFPLFKKNLDASVINVDTESSDYVVRDLNDFIYFTARPWNLIVPSVDHPFLGGVSYEFYDVLENKWKYFLADDYNINEHGGLYLGIFNIIVFVCALKNIRKKDSVERSNKYLYLFMFVFLLLLSGPPFFTLAGFKIYLPSYLIASYVPFFRVLSRLFIFAFVPFLLIVALELANFVKKPTNYIVLGLYLVIALYDFSLPTRLLSPDNMPRMYQELVKDSTSVGPLVIYPESESIQALHWQRYYKLPIVNPRGYKRVDYQNDKFTKNLTTQSGIDQARELGAASLLVKDTENQSFHESFEVLEGVVLVAQYDRYYLFRL